MKFARKKEDVTLDFMNVILGGFLFLTPWIFGFAGARTAAYNAWVGGLLVVAIALAAVYAFELWQEGVNALLGLWMAISPWALGFSGASAAAWTHLLIGIAVAAIAIVAFWRQYDPPQRAT